VPPKKNSGGRRRAGLFERLALSFMGPPSVGDVNAPLTYVPDASAHLCPTCGQDWDRHKRVHATHMTYARCPEPAAVPAG
jgi:predicted RNA-binding Zn-ribbon protein involved in translation (DUF1610 family)